MDCQIPELHTHNVFLADDYQDSFDDIFKRQLIPKKPSFYVNVPSRVDPTAAPTGKDAIVVLVPVGHLLEDGASEGLNPQSRQDWAAMVDKAREAVLTTVEHRTGAMNLHQVGIRVGLKRGRRVDRPGGGGDALCDSRHRSVEPRMTAEGLALR